MLKKEQPMPLPLVMKTDAFEDGGVVPQRYSCFGDNVQPEFVFQNIPENAASLACCATTSTWRWTAAPTTVCSGRGNISPDEGGLPEGRLPPGAVSGRNVENRSGYLGPGARPGRVITTTCSSCSPSIASSITSHGGKRGMLRAMDGHVIDKAAYVGRFRRERLN